MEKFREEIAPYAAQMVAHLAAAFARYSAQEGEGDEDGDDDDMAGIAAYGCLRAINTLLESVAGLGQQLYPVLEETLYPLMHKLISSDGQDVIEEVLEMLAYLTFYGPGISPRLWALWPQMHQMLMEFGIDYWENLLVGELHSCSEAKKPSIALHHHAFLVCHIAKWQTHYEAAAHRQFNNFRLFPNNFDLWQCWQVRTAIPCVLP